VRLLGEVRRAKDGEAADLGPVEELAGDEQGLDRLADAGVVGEEEASRARARRKAAAAARAPRPHRIVGPHVDPV
jgi:hypothetical protein